MPPLPPHRPLRGLSAPRRGGGVPRPKRHTGSAQGTNWATQDINRLALVKVASTKLDTSSFLPAGTLARSPAAGRAAWAMFRSVDDPLVIAFDWIQLAPSIIVMADPLQIQSNILVIGSDGQPLSRGQQICWHLGVLGTFAWQELVEIQHADGVNLTTRT